MGNVRFLAKKMDDLAALSQSQREYRKWLHKDIPDDNATVTGFQTVRADKDSTKSGKRKGGGTGLYRPPKYSKDFTGDFANFLSGVMPAFNRVLIFENFHLLSHEAIGQKLFYLIIFFNLVQHDQHSHTGAWSWSGFGFNSSIYCLLFSDHMHVIFDVPLPCPGPAESMGSDADVEAHFAHLNVTCQSILVKAGFCENFLSFFINEVANIRACINPSSYGLSTSGTHSVFHLEPVTLPTSMDIIGHIGRQVAQLTCGLAQGSNLPAPHLHL